MEEAGMKSRNSTQLKTRNTIAKSFCIAAVFLIMAGCDLFHDPFLETNNSGPINLLLINGNFELGNYGFVSNYTYGSCGNGEHYYDIINNQL